MKTCEEFTSKQIIWGCSVSQIPWAKLGFKSKKLEMLAILHGFYYNGHRALIDVDATALILSKSEYLKTLIINAKTPSIRVKAKGADFASKDLLKADGYKWNVPEKFWWRDVDAVDIDKIKTWLDDVSL